MIFTGRFFKKEKALESAPLSVNAEELAFLMRYPSRPPIDASTVGDFSSDNMLSMLAYATFAYVPRIVSDGQDAVPVGGDLAARWGYAPDECIPILSAHGTQGYILQKDDEMAITFRGTDRNDKLDYNRNFNWLTTRGPGGTQVHAGCNKILHDPMEHSQGSAFEAIESRVKDFLKNNPYGRIFLTGHSRGGAVAGLCAASLVEANPGYADHIADTYTFGQNRIGTMDFARYVTPIFGDRYFRVVGNDGVSYLPLRHPLPFNYRDSESHASLGYAHIGRLVSVSQDGEMKVDNSGFYSTLQDIALMPWVAMGRARQWVDPEHVPDYRGLIDGHRLSSYIDVVSKVKEVGSLTQADVQGIIAQEVQQSAAIETMEEERSRA